MSEQVNGNKKGKIILVVDDSQMVRSSFLITLTEAGHTVLEAKNGIEALKTLKMKKVDLILLDIQMPQMNGFELLRMVKNDVEVKGIPIICITNLHTKLEDIHHLMELGASGHFKKDGSPEDLLFRINRALSSK